VLNNDGENLLSRNPPLIKESGERFESPSLSKRGLG